MLLFRRVGRGLIMAAYRKGSPKGSIRVGRLALRFANR